MSKVGFYFSVYTHRRSLWKSTIALALYPGNRNVTVVFDPAPDSIKVFMYNVSLINAESGELHRCQLVSEQPKPLLFEKTPDGLYYVSVSMTWYAGNLAGGIASCCAINMHIHSY